MATVPGTPNKKPAKKATQRITRTTLGPPPDLTADRAALKAAFAETETSSAPTTFGQSLRARHSQPASGHSRIGREAPQPPPPASSHPRFKAAPQPEEKDPEVTPTEVATTIAKRGTGAAVQGSAILSGAVMGTKLANTIPAPPVIKAGLLTTGLLGGAIAGHLFGEGVTEFLEEGGLAFSDLKDVRPNLRPFAAFGEVLGGGLPFVGAPLLAARLGVQLPTSYAGDFINGLIRSAKTAPLSFGTSNTAALAQAGVASGAVEAVAPDSPFLRAGAEVIGGATSSLRSKAIGKITNKLVKTLENLTPAGRRTTTGKLLVNALEEGGSDPNVVSALLDDADNLLTAGDPLTAAQTTGDPVLAEIQRGLEGADPAFAGAMARQVKSVTQATTNAIRLLRGTGAPEAIREAAELRRGQMEVAISGMVDDAKTQIQRAAETLSPDKPPDMAKLSKQAAGILDDTIGRTREVEKGLWDLVPDGPLPPEGYQSVLEAYEVAKTQLLKQETINPLVARVVDDIKQAKTVMELAAQGSEKVTPKQIKAAVEQLSIGEMIKMRSKFLRLARASAKANDPDKLNDQRIFTELADATLVDLERAGVSGGPVASAAARTAFDDARTFSRQIKDVFTRSLVGELDEVGRRGQPSYNPESLLRRSLLVGEEMTDTNFKELELASRFLLDRNRGTDLDARQFQNMLQIQERALRLMAAGSVKRDPFTNEVIGVDAQKLRTMSTKYAEVFDRFPEAKQVIDGAIKSEGGLQTMMNIAKEQRGFLAQKSVIAKILDVESPVGAVRTILSDKNPQGLFARAATLAKNSGPEAEAGLRAATFESAIEAATTNRGQVELPALVAALTKPLRPGVPSTLRLLRQQQLITDKEAKLLDQLVDRANHIIDASQSRATGQPIEDTADALIDTIVRITGSFAGTGIEKKVGGLLGQTSSAGTSLIAAKRGSEASRALFAKAGHLKARTLLQGAMRGDPITPGGERFGLLKVLLEKGQAPERLEQNLMLVNAYLLSVGVRTTKEVLQGESTNGNP